MTDRKSLIALGIAVLLAVAVVGGLLLIDRAGGFGGDDRSGYVKTACRDWVKDRLKAPASADFSEEAVSRNGESYVVTGAVDAENSFGAPIRSNYRCEATSSDGESRLVSLTGLGN